MKELREIIRFWETHRNEPLALATLVRTHGSSYRRPGARMLISSDGAAVGSLSAGCIEEEVIPCAREVIASGRPRLLAFDTRRRFGCNGSIQVFVECACDDVLRALRDCLLTRRGCELATVFEKCESLGTQVASEFIEPGAFVQRIQAPLRLIIIGSGPDPSALERQARLLGWEAIAIDAIPQLREMLDARTAAVIATHNFGRDCAALRYLLPLGLRYVGLLGPPRRREELLVDVIDSGAAIKSDLFAPAGLALDAETPDEIALSVVAEIQSVLAETKVEHLRDRKAPIHASNFAEWTASAR